MPPISEKTTVSIKIASIGSALLFVIVCTWNVSKFISGAEEFQRRTDARLTTLEVSARTTSESAKSSAESTARAIQDIRDAQRDVTDDRWRASDQGSWGVRFERLNRNVQRTDGSTGILVPESYPALKKPE